jgi:hypothetical protein
MLEACSKAPGVDSIRWTDLDDPECRRWLFESLLEIPLEEAWDSHISRLNIQINMLEQSKVLWENREGLAALRAEVIEATRRLPKGEMEWMG